MGTKCFSVSVGVTPESTAILNAAQIPQPCYQYPATQTTHGRILVLWAPAWLQPPNISFNQVYIFLFINKDSGVRCCGENMLDQRNRETTSRPSFLTRYSEKKKKKKLSLQFFKLKRLWISKSILTSSCVSLFIHIPASSVLALANFCQLVPGSAPWSKIYFINKVTEFHIVIKYIATKTTFKNF